MITRTTLLEQLAAAETNLEIAKFEEAREWKAYDFVIEERLAGRTTYEVVDEYGQRAQRYTDNRKEKWQAVNTLKAQLLELDEIAAALHEAKLEQLTDRVVDFTVSELATRNCRWLAGILRDPGEKAYYLELAKAQALAAGVFAAQVSTDCIPVYPEPAAVTFHNGDVAYSDNPETPQVDGEGNLLY